MHYPQLPSSGTQDNPVNLDLLPNPGRYHQVNGPTNETISDCKKLVETITSTATPVSSNSTVASSPTPPSSNSTVAPRSSVSYVVPVPEPVLDEEQSKLVDLIVSRRNVFYTGSAGTGKSTVLKALVKRFKQLDITVDIVAPTGRAALDIQGSTTWTYAGWTPDTRQKPLDELLKDAHARHV